jgi:hypothetical protein
MGNKWGDMSEREKRELCQDRVTLNGKPAVVTGYKNEFAMVKALDSCEQAEFAWETVARIVNLKNGAFRA